MNELLNQFEKETGNRTEDCGPKIYRDKYVQWLEAKVVQWLEAKVAQNPEVSEKEPDFNAQALAAFNRMLVNEQCGGTGWWSGWEALKTALWKLQP